MSFFNGVISISNVSTLLFVVFAVLLFGYILGRITIKGVSLGDAGVFIIALVCGALFFHVNDAGELLFAASSKPYDFNGGLSIIESLGLVLFVTSVGYIAGPKFFATLKKNFKSYVLLGLIIILAGGLAAVGCIFAGDVIGYGGAIEDREGFVAMIVGLLSGALTSTPAFSASKATVAECYTSLVSVGYGIAYIFGVIGVVLFVQIIPKLTKANMDEERSKLIGADAAPKKATSKKIFEIDHAGIAAFSLAAILGTVIGQIKIPLTSAGLSGSCFSLTTTGGCLLVSLVLGHFGRIGNISIMPTASTLKLFRELGLVFFLAGAGIPGGAEFVATFDPMYFVYGMVMTLFPLIIGYLFAKYVLKLSLLNNLGSITGGMTSTPALGTLITTAKTEDVVAAYAATYPIALISVVLVSQFIVILF
ncbi:MAG: permease [Clostridia bacterium]|nr:permease [Clostridia bacterium]